MLLEGPRDELEGTRVESIPKCKMAPKPYLEGKKNARDFNCQLARPDLGWRLSTSLHLWKLHYPYLGKSAAAKNYLCSLYKGARFLIRNIQVRKYFNVWYCRLFDKVDFGSNDHPLWKLAFSLRWPNLSKRTTYFWVSVVEQRHHLRCWWQKIYEKSHQRIVLNTGWRN